MVSLRESLHIKALSMSLALSVPSELFNIADKIIQLALSIDLTCLSLGVKQVSLDR